MLDKAVIEEKMDIVERNLQFLKSFAKMEEKEFLESYKDVQAAKFSLLECIEACIDIAGYLIVEKGLKRPESYAEVFLILGEEGLLDESLIERLSDMARFRNFLVHRYGEVDNKRVLEFIKENLRDIYEFRKAVLNID